MTENQYRNCIDMLGLSQERAAQFLGISPRTSRSYALGEHKVPEPVAKLLRLMIRLQIKPEDVP
jgi:transcriptional regulator with XRE-family HTH domain